MSDASDSSSKHGSPRGDRLGRRQMSLMQVFRAAARNRDARDPGRVDGGGTHGGDGALQDAEITRRSQQRRDGASETALRADLSQDVASLMNTIRLDATIDLADAPYVQKSVINYGFQDLSSLTRNQRMTGQIADSIRQTLIEHEPRLIAASIEVRMPGESDDTDHRLKFDISADMIATPADIPLDFVAEVDLGAGKIHMQRLRVGG
ncbi:MAG: type VI secretion system baseplate subunit TssE [Paracoccus sp. (in: a-proteobacteria)]|nr:type VI secretion system baseplate subunit TssE [Paracoccus sp. (in: a-proteobacteria)]